LIECQSAGIIYLPAEIQRGSLLAIRADCQHRAAGGHLSATEPRAAWQRWLKRWPSLVVATGLGSVAPLPLSR